MNKTISYTKFILLALGGKMKKLILTSSTFIVLLLSQVSHAQKVVELEAKNGVCIQTISTETKIGTIESPIRIEANQSEEVTGIETIIYLCKSRMPFAKVKKSKDGHCVFNIFGEKYKAKQGEKLDIIFNNVTYICE